MTLHPIRVLDHVVEEYRDYLLTEFRAKDRRLKEALESELDRPGFLAQEPFFQAHRPFKDGKRWADLPIDPRLAKTMAESTEKEHCYLHQSEAITHLLGPQASPVVVTTGTGSGKTECFLLPVIQNAFEDATRFKRSGITVILIYPMNALANDQLQRIEEYLEASGLSGVIDVAKYDRGTSAAQREALRKNPPHILLTNYMMLEYLLVRPADREAMFANHRCRFLVLDEVHTYRGVLGSNVALLVRRLKAHLSRARQDWNPDVPEAERSQRYPKLITIGTSATIRSLDEEGLSPDQAREARDAAVQEFFARLTGADTGEVMVLGEELQDIQIPDDARYGDRVAWKGQVDYWNAEAVRHALCRLAGIEESAPLEEASRKCRILWDLNALLIRKPMSVDKLVTKLKEEVPQRRDWAEDDIRREVELALNLGAALPEPTPGSLQLRAHRFIRGGWQFHRCVDPACGKLYPMGEEECDCGRRTAPLYLCRNCGADYLRFVGDDEANGLRPSSVRTEGAEWLMYEPERFEVQAEDDEEVGAEEDGESASRAMGRRLPKQIKRRPVLRGSLDITTLSFSANESDYPLRVMLSPARTQCLCCGGTAGSRNVITPVALGTSAAVKVLGEGLLDALGTEHPERGDSDDKDRLLIFSDSRQDAAHQARFIIFASRYDRMRRRVVQILESQGPLTLQRTVELLGDIGVQQHDNPYAPQEASAWIPTDQLRRIQAWEEAPLLDELAVNAGYRATLVNLGLMDVAYDRLSEYVEVRGEELSARLGLESEKLAYLCARLLDDIRARGCLSRDMLRYSPFNPSCPEWVHAAEWERRITAPQGYAADDAGNPVPYVDANGVPRGVRAHNAWRKSKTGGRAPRLEHTFEHLMAAFGGVQPHEELLVEVLTFLRDGSFLRAVTLHGAREQSQLVQVNAEAIRLELAQEGTRCRCAVCSVVVSPAKPGFPCPRCHGQLARFPDIEVSESRYARRIRAPVLATLVVREHTAQVPHDERSAIEEQFKGKASDSLVNVLACSPTLELGINVGGLDAVVMRNVPPRPDNYAQRGGRVGRHSRVGLVVGYARSTPHDQYFYDRPEEMIAGEVPVPVFALGNRDVVFRHLNAIAFGAAEPGVAGKMVDYVGPMGDIKQENVTNFIDGVRNASGEAVTLALEAWRGGLLAEAELDSKALEAALVGLEDRITDVIQRTARQVLELREALDTYYRELRDPHAGQRAGDLVARLLGIARRRGRETEEADDRSAGYPLRRFAEFGILPGYEFPAEPAALRLMGDGNEEEPVTTARRYGIGQFQPGAQVFARTHRWRVSGLDPASPWNPLHDAAGWLYRLCKKCGLRFDANDPRCPRCGADLPGQSLVAMEYAGFLGRRDEAPILDEEDRYAARTLVSVYPQWDGDVVGRWSVGPGWGLRLSRGETAVWLNEGQVPTPKELESASPRLHDFAKGYLLCSYCGRTLQPEEPEASSRGGRRRARGGGQGSDPFGHAAHCSKVGTPPHAVAIVTAGRGESLRLLCVLPDNLLEREQRVWGLSLGYALRAGMIRYFALSDGDIDFELEAAWATKTDGVSFNRTSLVFVDPNLGGSGYLPRIAERFNDVAKAALEHLQHADCETSCYRCLKAYENQRFHEYLSWPRVVGDLQNLSEGPPEPRPLKSGDIDDPGPWLEAYAEGVGSPLELKFLRLFQQHNLPVEKQVPVAPADGEAPISVADFAVAGARIAIYIDGAAFHVGQNLRRDIFIRERLRNGSPPWKVVELRAADLGRGQSLVEQVKSIARGTH
jgi:hypothetical protein